jgi:tripartite-type tricarboxylate transporter receptor subunit TctC
MVQGEDPMKVVRRDFLRLGAAAIAAIPSLAMAEAYPVRSVRVIVGFGPGGAADILARLIGQRATERLGQPFIIDNRPGAGTNIATEAVVKAAPDGYTLLLINPAAATNATLYEKLNFNFIRDIAPVASIASGPLAMLVNPSFPAKGVPEFIAYAKANPGKITMASAGAGSPPHVAGELFKMMTGVELLHVPYRGGDSPALADLIGGQVQVYFATLLSSIEHVKAGTLRALAITTKTRSEALPDVPTLSEYVPGYEATLWNGIGAPRGTPPEVIKKLNNEVNAALADPVIKARIGELGSTVLPGSAADFAKLISEETEKWAQVIRAAHIKLD